MEAAFQSLVADPSSVEDDLAPSLMLDDGDDLVPLRPSTLRSQPEPQVADDASPEASDAPVVRVMHPAYAPPLLMQRAVAWVADPRPTWGWRAWVLFATGLNLGPSRRERELRQWFVALFSTGHDHKEHRR